MLDDDKVVVVRVLRHGVSQQTVMQRSAMGLLSSTVEGLLSSDDQLWQS